jgi:hypothetical protein
MRSGEECTKWAARRPLRFEHGLECVEGDPQADGARLAVGVRPEQLERLLSEHGMAVRAAEQPEELPCLAAAPALLSDRRAVPPKLEPAERPDRETGRAGRERWSEKRPRAVSLGRRQPEPWRCRHRAFEILVSCDLHSHGERRAGVAFSSLSLPEVTEPGRREHPDVKLAGAGGPAQGLLEPGLRGRVARAAARAAVREHRHRRQVGVPRSIEDPERLVAASLRSSRPAE